MTDPPHPTTSDPTAAAEKDPDDWVTGDEPMTGPQASYLATLAQDTGSEVPEALTKSEASKLIDELQAESSRISEGTTTPSGTTHRATSGRRRNA
jgi:Protein of unknown function (DUF3072)